MRVWTWACWRPSSGRWGDSLLVVGGEGQYKVHVHSDEPGDVLSAATKRGVLSEIEIDNMKEQTAARTRRLLEAEGSESTESVDCTGHSKWSLW